MGRAAGHGPPSTLPAPPLPRSYLAIPATSWVDDFLDWLNPTGRCCRIHQFGSLAGQFCPSTSSEWALVLAGGGLLGGGEGGGTAMPGGWMLGARRAAHWDPTGCPLGVNLVLVGCCNGAHRVLCWCPLVPTMKSIGCLYGVLFGAHQVPIGWVSIGMPLGAH